MSLHAVPYWWPGGFADWSSAANMGNSLHQRKYGQNVSTCLRQREHVMKQSSETVRSIRQRRPGCQFALSAGIGLLAAACTTVIPSSGPPTVIRSTPFGSQVVSGNQPVVQPGGTLAAPPAGLEPNRPPAAAVGDRSGIYGGTAVPLNTGGGLCIANQTISGFKVDGNSVRWGRFRGTIAADNGLQMVNGNTSVFGRFVGDRFEGQMSTTRRASGPGCSFMMSLERTSS
nr:hypothetical protein [uncultured Rhodopila sp.]